MSAYLLVALLAAVDLWLAVPATLALKIDPLAAFFLIATTSSVGALLTIFCASKAQLRLAARFGSASFFGGRTKKHMDKFGTAGLGLMAPLVLGPLLTCVCGVALGAKPRQLAMYAVAGAVIWSGLIYFLLAAQVLHFPGR
ncbi:hypothetical protein [Janthinobacterium fluminis]|uniref:Small multi-drug export protein n=1 Tax=Janthinobacterium fluminis TaxID=2987524 RepID=A0ABT5K803_9BURK|nr:hypothetical protein [Janthinobacterium fluminis]MDC8760196.1 hypothetical protein [Janthinobacterium fluminis]